MVLRGNVFYTSAVILSPSYSIATLLVLLMDLSLMNFSSLLGDNGACLERDDATPYESEDL